MKHYRKWLVERLEQSGAEYIAYLSQLAADELNAKPSPTAWSIHQVAAHMRDTEREAFVVRAERLLNETQPTFANFEQADYWRTHPYAPDEPLKQIIADFRAMRRKLVRLLRKAPTQAWRNYGWHSAYGKISLDWVALHCYHHTLEHIAQMGQVREQALLKELNR